MVKKVKFGVSVFGLAGFLCLAGCAGKSPAADPVESFWKETGPQALAMLRDMMTSDDSEIRIQAALAWGRIGNPSAIPLLVRALGDMNGHVRIAAAWSLWKLGDLGGVRVLEKIAREVPDIPDGSNPLLEMKAVVKNKVRASAISTLAKIKGQEAVPFLDKMKNDPFGTVRDAVHVSLARLGKKRAVMKQFVAAVKSEEDSVRLAAVQALGQIGGGDAVYALKSATKDKSSRVRAAVMTALGDAGDVIALLEIQEGLNDTNALVRVRAAEALSRIRSPSSLPALRNLLVDSDNMSIRVAACEGLAHQGDLSGLNDLEDALESPDPDIRKDAAHALGVAGGARSARLLRKALLDDSLAVRAEAAEGLLLISVKGRK